MIFWLPIFLVFCTSQFVASTSVNPLTSSLMKNNENGSSEVGSEAIGLAIGLNHLQDRETRKDERTERVRSRRPDPQDYASPIQRKLLSTVNRNEEEEKEMKVEHFQKLFQRFKDDKDIQRILGEKSSDNKFLLFWLDMLNTTDIDAIEDILNPDPKSEIVSDNLNESEKQQKKDEQILEELKAYVDTLSEIDQDHGEHLDELEQAAEIMEFFELGNSVIAILRQMERLEKLNEKHNSEQGQDQAPDLDVLRLEKILTTSKMKDHDITTNKEEEELVEEEVLMPLDEDEEEYLEASLNGGVREDVVYGGHVHQEDLTDEEVLNEDANLVDVDKPDVEKETTGSPKLTTTSTTHFHSKTILGFEAENFTQSKEESSPGKNSSTSPLKSSEVVHGSSLSSSLLYFSMSVFGLILLVGLAYKRVYLGRIFWNRFMSRIRPFHYRRS